MNRFAMVMMIGFVAFIAISVTAVSVQKCGWKTFIFGKNTALAIMTGMCEE